MPIPKFNLKTISDEITNPWSPKDIATVNNAVIRIAQFHGHYHWHTHEHHDEIFLVYKGTITVQTTDGDILLNEHEGVKIPKGREHCPSSPKPSIVLMFEPLQLISEGDYVS
jgi:mannose-6-phosphate isomerase-like protein (cupin superfamily)